MAAVEIPAGELGLPAFDVSAARADADAFDLASHARAREALAFGLALREPGFNVFVLGEDRSGRMSATLEFLAEALAGRPAPGDWVYRNNFAQPSRPRAQQLPQGIGRRFRDRLAALVPRLREALARALSTDGFQDTVRQRTEVLRAEAAKRIEALRAAARAHGLETVESERGVVFARPPGAAEAPIAPADAQRLGAEAEAVNLWLAAQQAELARWRDALARQVAEQTTGALLDEVVGEFQGEPGLARWLTEMRVDLVERVPLLVTVPAEEMPAAFEAMQRRYAVNLLVDNADAKAPPVVVEPNPGYETVFGRIDYRQEQGALSTDFSLVRAGALHRANGGVLVLRAEAVAADAELWTMLKAALRDGEIRIEERHRSGGPPIASAPQPGAVPLDARIVLVGHPRWYHLFFGADPDFITHFKVRAEIDADVEATPGQVANYAGLVRRMAARRRGVTIGDDAVARLLATASRWAEDRARLSARFELVEDLLAEAAALAPRGPGGAAHVDAAAVMRAQAQRRRRNARVEDRVHEAIADGRVLIDVAGMAVGQINALTVRETGDHAFGAPSRVTARASMGRRGVINIERDVALGGPIQQKGAMVIQGWLTGRFARRMPMSFACSVTFEQSYGGVEGDSASLAELVAILSDLSGVPLRQDLAITGSVNQLGQAQAIGGARHKVEGFFRACTDRGALTGTQGVVLPAANARNLVLRDEVVEAVAAGRFHVWTVRTIEEALGLFTGMEPGTPDAEGAYPPGSVLGRVMATLEAFDRRLSPPATR
jgi:predicted ATP-dependent protease